MGICIGDPLPYWLQLGDGHEWGLSSIIFLSLTPSFFSSIVLLLLLLCYCCYLPSLWRSSWDDLLLAWAIQNKVVSWWTTHLLVGWTPRKEIWLRKVLMHMLPAYNMFSRDYMDIWVKPKWNDMGWGNTHHQVSSARPGIELIQSVGQAMVQNHGRSQWGLWLTPKKKNDMLRLYIDPCVPSCHDVNIFNQKSLKKIQETYNIGRF